MTEAPTPKRGPGRPPKPAGTHATARLDLRTSAAQLAAYEAAARAAGHVSPDGRVLTAEWARAQLDAAAAGASNDGTFERGVREGLARARALISEAIKASS